jgi:hypothetical protein
MTKPPAESAQQPPDHFDVLLRHPARDPDRLRPGRPQGGGDRLGGGAAGGRAYIVPHEEDGHLVHISLERVVHGWAPRKGVNLVLVTSGVGVAPAQRRSRRAENCRYHPAGCNHGS